MTTHALLRPARLAALIALAAAPLAHAAEISTLQLLTQSEFRRLAEDIGSVMSYKAMGPAEAGGVTGFDIGLVTTGTQLQNRDVWRKAAAGADVPSTLPTVGVRVNKGLPFNIDVGAAYSTVPTTSFRSLSGEVRWAVLPGSTVTPAVAVRLSGSSLRNVSQLSATTTGLDVSVSKGFAMLTPYAGAGVVRTWARPEGTALLREERFNQSKVYAGVAASLGLARLTVEADRTGDATSVGAKLSVGF